MFKVEHHILIDESPKVVWAFLANLPVSLTCHRPRRCFQWMGNPKPAPGNRYLIELSMLGITFRQEGRITFWEPPCQVALAQWNPRHPHRGFIHQRRLSVHPVDGQPHAAMLRLTVVGNLWSRLVEIVFKEIVRRGVLDHLLALKRAIESTDKSSRPERATTRRLAEMPVLGG